LQVLEYDQLILAAGTRELFLPIPNWTLPGVFGAGGFQALVKSGLPVKGRRVVVAGSGPLLLAVTATLLAHGAEVALVAEQAPWRRIVRFALHLLRRHFRKFREGISLRRSLRRTPYRTGCWPRSCLGTDKLHAVAMTDGTRHWVEPCDYLACGFGLVPNLELPLLFGCELDGNQVKVDEHQKTRCENVFVAGELTGIGGLELALIEGQIAGYAAAGDRQRAERLLKVRRRQKQFASRLRSAFALRSELFRLAESETVICRCEDVPYSALRGYASWREAKLHSRCGMGPCQARICGPALEHLLGWTVESVRPPLFPTPISGLLAEPPKAPED
jgi:D-hydroxyproline dehydrogenase subunit alpha